MQAIHDLRWRGMNISVRRGLVAAGRRVLLVVGLLCLLAPGAAAAGVRAVAVSPDGKTVSDNFSAIDHRYWTDQAFGGVEIASDGMGLLFSIPSEVTAGSFQGLVTATQSFFIKANARFATRLAFECVTWPHANGTSLVLMVTVFDKANKNQVYQMSVGRQSNNFSRAEEFWVSVWGHKKKHVWKVVPAIGRWGYLQVGRDEHGFVLNAVEYTPKKKKVSLYKFSPKVKKLGKATWAFMVQGQQAHWAYQPVTLRVDRFTATSNKGFSFPPAQW